MTDQAELERALRAVPFRHTKDCEDGFSTFKSCSCSGEPDYPALAATVWALWDAALQECIEGWMLEVEKERQRANGNFQSYERIKAQHSARLTEHAEREGRLRDALVWAQVSCRCGARGNSAGEVDEHNYPHVGGCPVGTALAPPLAAPRKEPR